MKYKSGYCMLTLGWSDGNSFVPIDHCLLSAADDKNPLRKPASFDGRSLAGKRRKESRRKATEVMVDLVRAAQSSGGLRKTCSVRQLVFITEDHYFIKDRL